MSQHRVPMEPCYDQLMIDSEVTVMPSSSNRCCTELNPHIDTWLHLLVIYL